MSSEFHTKLLGTLGEIHSAIGVETSAFLDMLQLDQKSYERLQQGQSEIQIKHLEALCDALYLSIDSLLSNEVDLGALAKRFRGDQSPIPERYADPAQQIIRGRTVNTIVRYASLLKGRKFSERVLKRLQVPAYTFQRNESFQSVRFGADLLKELTDEGISNPQVREMGTMTLITNYSTPIGRVFSSMKSGREIYESLINEHVHFFDRMWNYRILKLGRNTCTIEMELAEAVQEAFKNKAPGSRELCVFRQGVFMAFAGNINKRLARVLESECVYLGSPRCVYHVSWDDERTEGHLSC